MLLSACGPDETISGYADTSATYVLQEINGSAFIAKASIRFPKEGEVSGEGPCNSFGASQTAPYPWIELSQLRATRRACPDLPAEATYFTLLETMTFAEIVGGTLILSNSEDQIMVFQSE